MILQILINRYKESDKVIRPLLQSINIQQGIDLHNDVGVVICNDGYKKHLSDSLLNGFEYPVKMINNPHKGVSFTRNTLLDYASAEYVMFCDADDMFVTVNGLYVILLAIKKARFDVFVSEILNESNHTDVGINRYSRIKKDTEFVHGKVFRREWLIDNNIRWKDEMTYSGDTYFLHLGMAYSGRRIYCKEPLYMWKWNENSICRSEEDHFQKSYHMRIKGDDLLISDLVERGKDDAAKLAFLRTIYDAYFMSNTEGWKRLDDIDEKEACVRDFYNKYSHLISDLDEYIKAMYYSAIKRNYYALGVYKEAITFDDWISHILRSEKE